MITYYEITDKQGIQKSSSNEGNWIVLEKATESEQADIVSTYQLPRNIFIGGDEAEEVSRLEQMDNPVLGDIKILVLTNLSAKTDQSIEQRLEPLIFIISDALIITYVGDNSNFVDRFIKRFSNETSDLNKLCANVIYLTYAHFIKELLRVKKVIDELDQAARKTTENEALFRLADTQRDVIYLDHTLRGQAKTLTILWEETDFATDLNDTKLLYNIKLRQSHAEELIHIYRDLLETVGGLFSDMMDNNLNHLMKYLDSAALVLAIPALISGIWGMNAGGLPGEGSKMGFFIVIGCAIVLSIIFAIHLKRKDYTK